MRRFRRITTPKHAHPLVRLLFSEMNSQRIGIYDVSDRSGVACNTMKNWRKHHTPSVSNLEACLNVLGFELVVKPRKD